MEENHGWAQEADTQMLPPSLGPCLGGLPQEVLPDFREGFLFCFFFLSRKEKVKVLICCVTFRFGALKS
jgi:hypothetical protein